ncbi:MAG: RidA family protein, partial [Candidatus Binataceae bacterium]
MTAPARPADRAGAITRIAGGGPYEPIVGYSRAVRAGDWIAVSGTTGFDASGQIVGQGQMYVQTRQAIANIASALGRAGASFADVVRTRMFVTDIERFAEVARAHRETFGAAPPASTAVEVRRLVHPDMLVEIEVDAFTPAAAAPAGVASAGSKPRARRVARAQPRG